MTTMIEQVERIISRAKEGINCTNNLKALSLVTASKIGLGTWKKITNAVLHPKIKEDDELS